MASVYLAVQTSLDREVALKVMSPALAADEAFSKRFVREAKTIAGLTHPNIVPIYDVGVTDDFHHYFSMQHLTGGDLGGKIRAGLSEQELIRVLAGIARALGYAHSRGFVHRDVTPGNILFDAADTAVLTDFGIARAVTDATRITGTGVSIGTSHYMSPEQARGAEVDSRADIYSLGALAFESLTGSPPYTGDDGFAVAYAHVYDPVPTLPAELEHWQPVINRAMAKSPDDRYQKATEFVEDTARLARAQFGTDATRDDTLRMPTAPETSAGRRVGRRRSVPDLSTLAALPSVTRKSFSSLKAVGLRLGDTLQGHWRQVKKGIPERWHWPAVAAGLAVPLLLVVALWLSLGGDAEPPTNLAATNQSDTNQDGATATQTSQASPDPAASAPLRRQTSQPETTRDSNTGADLRERMAQVRSQGSETGQETRVDGQAATDGRDFGSGIGSSDEDVYPRFGDDFALPSEPTLPELIAATSGGDAVAGDMDLTVDQLLMLANEHLEATRLTTPADNNAFDGFSQVLELEPDNQEAQEGLQKITERYFGLTRAAVRDGDFQTAARYLGRASMVAESANQEAMIAQVEQQLDNLFSDRLVAGERALAAEDQMAAESAFNAALALKPANQVALAGLERADQLAAGPSRIRDDLATGGRGPNMVVVPAGTIILGSGGDATRVQVPSFAMSEREVTVDEFTRFAGATGFRRDMPCRSIETQFQRASSRLSWRDPGFPQTISHPVTCIDFPAAQALAQWMSQQTGQRYRLPTEAEWEYAYRAGLDNGLPPADQRCRYSNVGDTFLQSEYPSREVHQCEDGWVTTSPVGSFQPDGLGLYDLIGNVREWVADCWVPSHAGRPATAVARSDGGCAERVVKGGAWHTAPEGTVPSYRFGLDPENVFSTMGFRLVREIDSG